MMTTGKVVVVGEAYLQVIKTEIIGLQNLALIEKLLISLLNTMPPMSISDIVKCFQQENKI